MWAGWFAPRGPARRRWLLAKARPGVLLCLALTAFCSASARASNSKSILVIEQEDTARPAFVAMLSSMRESLATNLPGQVVVYTENLDLARFDNPKYRDQLERWFRTKYRGRSLDAIVAAGERSLEMTLSLRADLWPAVPVLFLGVHPDRAVNYAARENVSGVSVEVDVAGTLTVALQLCPETRHIAFVASEQGYPEVYRDVRRSVERFATNGFQFVPLTDLTMSETKERLANLPRQTVVFYLAMWMDANGQILNPRDALAELAAVSNAPIFGMSDTHLGYGILGGYCINYSLLGFQVGERVAAVVRAGNASGVPVVRSAANQLLFDWRQLKRFNLAHRQLPHGAEVRFRPSGLWETHREAVIIVIAALLLQSVLIAALLGERVHRRRAERNLRDTEERMSLAVQATGLGMWAWQADSDGSAFSPRCRRICGFGTEHAMGRAEGCTGADAKVCPMLSEALGKLSVANPTFETECLHGLEEQKPCWIASRGRGYFDKDGKLQRLIGVSMDVTERKNSARSLQEQREQLAHVDRVSIMGQLASSLAHELNQPLGAILRNAEAAELFLRKDPPNLEELRAILADIRHDDERAGAVIDRMKALLQRRKFQIVAISLPVLFEDVISLAEPDATARQVQLRVEVDPNTPIVMGDRVQLQQVLLNLIINAIDAIDSCNPASRCVVVGAAAKPDGVEVFVLDSGPGILPELLPRVFEPFFTTKENGMGVGLPICRSIIEVHGGRIWGENNAESGATFRFTLPLSSGAEELAEVTGTGSPAAADTRGEPVTAPVYSI